MAAARSPPAPSPTSKQHAPRLCASEPDAGFTTRQFGSVKSRRLQNPNTTWIISRLPSPQKALGCQRNPCLSPQGKTWEQPLGAFAQTSGV